MYFNRILNSLETLAVQVQPAMNQSNLTIGRNNFAIHVTQLTSVEANNTTGVVTFTAAVNEDGEVNLDVGRDVEEGNTFTAELPVEDIQPNDTTLRFAFIIFNDNTLFQQRDSFQSRLPGAHGGILSVQVNTSTSKLKHPLRFQVGAGNVSSA